MRVSDLPIHLGSCLVIAHCAFKSILWSFATATQTEGLKAASFPKCTKNICMTYEMSAADLPKHLCYDGYLTSDSDLSVIIWPLCIWGKGQRKDHSFGLCMDH